METWRHEEIETWRHGDMETSNGNLKPRHLLNPFSISKQKLIVCPFVDEETNGIHLLAYGLNRINGPNGLNVLAHLWTNAIFACTRTISDI
jgi:hypothetical protein